jgi:hypothetical protein
VHLAEPQPRVGVGETGGGRDATAVLPDGPAVVTDVIADVARHEG